MKDERQLWLFLANFIPAPRGTGIVSAPVPKKLLLMAGTDDCEISARDCTAILDSFAFEVISKTYSYLTPDLQKETIFTKCPCQELTDHLVKTDTGVLVQSIQVPAGVTILEFLHKKSKVIGFLLSLVIFIILKEL